MVNYYGYCNRNGAKFSCFLMIYFRLIFQMILNRKLRILRSPLCPPIIKSSQKKVQGTTHFKVIIDLVTNAAQDEADAGAFFDGSGRRGGAIPPRAVNADKVGHVGQAVLFSVR